MCSIPHPDRRRVPHAGGRLRRAFAGTLLLCLAGGGGIARGQSGPEPVTEPPGSAAIRGLPLARSYSFEEIGDVSSGLRLRTDTLGRLIAFQEGVYLVFDDKNWTDLLEKENPDRNMAQTARAADGRTYFGAAGVWGHVEQLPDGRMSPRSLRPDQCPPWVSNTKFEWIVPTSRGVVFGGSAGVVSYDFATGHQQFIPAPDVVFVFGVGDQVFVSSYRRGLCRVDTGLGTIVPLEEAPTKGMIVERAAAWDEHRVVVVTQARVAGWFDGESIAPWPTEVDALLPDGIEVMLKLDEDHVAIVIKTHGLFILDARGRIVLTCDVTQFGAINDICLGEPGVLWISSAEGITKLLYRSPVTTFDHRLGVNLHWPDVVKHQGRTLIVSDGRVYEPLPARAGAPTHFREMDIRVVDGVWTMASTAHGLLYGNNHGLFHREDETGAISPVLAGINVSRIILAEPATQTCIVLGARAIAAVRWIDGRWQEIAPRIAGVGFPSNVITAAPNSVWYELGVNRVARVTLRDDVLQTHVMDEFPWPDEVWINLGAIGSTVILTHGVSERLYFDESIDAFRDAPELDHIFAEAPYSALRVREDAQGVIWVPHPRGVYRLLPEAGEYRADVDSLRVVRDNYPVVQVIDGSDVWIRTSRSLLRVDTSAPMPPPPRLQPVLTRVVDARRDREIFNALHPAPAALTGIPHGSNSLNFQFFPGTSSLLHTPGYQYRLEGYSDAWSLPTRDTTISLTRLTEGDYRMTVRLLDSSGPIGESTSFTFSIAAPWYRTWYAYGGFALVALAGFRSSFRWIMRRAEVKNAVLERLVQARTGELDRTNEQLRAAVIEAQEAARAKSQFLASMSHEIRTPMNGVIGMSNVLLDSRLTSEQSEYAETIRKSAEGLLTVLNDILDFSKFEAGKLRFEEVEFELAEAIEESLDLLAPRAAAKGIELASLLAPDVPARVRGDPGRLRQVLLNLVGNAVKFTDEGEVVVAVRRAGPAADGTCALCIEVRDTGIGIAPEVQTRLFQPFSQADSSTTRRFGGTGLGLAISRQIVDLMGGTITVDSGLGRGSRFTIMVSLGLPAAPAPDAPATGLRGKRLLAVSASATVVAAIRGHAEACGLSLTAVPDATEAVCAVAAAGSDGGAFHAVLIDVRVPAADGRPLARSLAEQAGPAPLPTVLVTTLDPRLTRLAISQSDATATINRPLRRADFIRVLRGVLLPAETASASGIALPEENAAGDETPVSLPSLRVLVVEDNLVNQRLVQLQLKKFGLRAELATNGLEALEALERADFDVVLMDCQMPEMDGYEATRRLRAHERHRHIRVIAMTANAMQGDREKCLAAGMDDYVAKPVHELELRAVLARAEIRAVDGPASSP